MAYSFFKKKEKFSDVDELGFSSDVEEFEGRVLNKNGSFNLIRKGVNIHIYHFLISMSWPQFFSLIFVAFAIVNSVFAFVYYIIGVEYVAGIEPSGFWSDITNLFHFSVQSMTTVGYGVMHPNGLITGIVASFEALIGLMSFGLLTGLIYGRFSNPKAEIRYAQNLIIGKVNGELCLQARVANELSHDLFDIKARILMLHNEKNEHGVLHKRYKTLQLEIDNISFLPMNWTIVHKINKESPIYGMTKDDMAQQCVEFLVLITAFDDSFSQLVHSRSSYLSDEILYNVKWHKTYYVNEDGTRVFDIERLDHYYKDPISEE